jgi:glutamate carboxypeptidase
MGAAASAAWSQGLTKRETQMQQWIAAHHEDAVGLLQSAVDINSGTFNVEGVRTVGELFRRELDALGFTTRWTTPPAEMRRAGTLIAQRRGPRSTAKTKRMLLIGHLDTVFEGEGQQFVRQDTVARGAGTSDMKGGDVVIVYALKALREAGALDELDITVVLTGDEESPGSPISEARQGLLDAATRNDIALAFEGGDAHTITNARRGYSTWLLRVSGKQGHSSAIFSPTFGYGAVYETARILEGFRTALAGRPHLTFSPGLIVGGTDVTNDSVRISGTAAGKLNIIARDVRVQGDLRFLTDAQLDSARSVMRSIVAAHLPGTSAEITFFGAYPGMSPTDGNRALAAVFNRVSQDLGYPAVQVNDPDKRGGGDVSFVAARLDALDGLGVDGFGAHSPEEGVYLPSITMATQRAAVLIHRLANPTGSHP